MAPAPSPIKLTGGEKLTPGWLAPPQGHAKINVDTAISKSDHGGAVAAVCRDDGEGFIGVSAITVDNFSNPAMLEALACHEALALAQYLNLHKICVASGNRLSRGG
jgi:hypothetical protein